MSRSFLSYLQRVRALWIWRPQIWRLVEFWNCWALYSWFLGVNASKNVFFLTDPPLAQFHQLCVEFRNLAVEFFGADFVATFFKFGQSELNEQPGLANTVDSFYVSGEIIAFHAGFAREICQRNLPQISAELRLAKT